MFRQQPHAATLVLVVALGGCVNVQRDAQEKPVESKLPDQPDPTKKPEASELPEIKAARETTDRLRRQSRDLGEFGSQLDTITTRMAEYRVLISSGSLDALIKGLMQTTASLRESAKVILERGPQFIVKIDGFSSTLETAPGTFGKAAALFRSFADEEPYADVADDYRQFAILFDHLTTRTQTYNVTLVKAYNRDQLLETLKYIRHQERFLERVEAALSVQDFELREVEALIRQIETYTSKFETFRTQIRDLNATFRGVDALTTKPQPTRTPPKRPAQATPKPTESVDKPSQNTAYLPSPAETSRTWPSDDPSPDAGTQTALPYSSNSLQLDPPPSGNASTNIAIRSQAEKGLKTVQPQPAKSSLTAQASRTSSQDSYAQIVSAMRTTTPLDDAGTVHKTLASRQNVSASDPSTARLPPHRPSAGSYPVYQAANANNSPYHAARNSQWPAGTAAPQTGRSLPTSHVVNSPVIASSWPTRGEVVYRYPPQMQPVRTVVTVRAYPSYAYRRR